MLRSYDISMFVVEIVGLRSVPRIQSKFSELLQNLKVVTGLHLRCSQMQSLFAIRVWISRLFERYSTFVQDIMGGSLYVYP